MPSMIIGVTSDWHVDAKTAGEPRFHEVAQFATAFAEQLRLESADLLLHLGDLFDPGRDDLRWSAQVIMMAREVSAAADVGALWLAGNHDVVDRDVVVTSLSPLREAAAMSETALIVAETPGVHGFTNGAMDLVVLAIPYPSKSDVDAWEETVDRAVEAVPRDVPVVVASHLCVEGAATGSETRDMARGTDVYLREKWLDAVDPVLVVNGHYHRRQVVRLGRHEVNIPGSPVRLTFAEADETHKGGLVVEVTVADPEPNPNPGSSSD